MSRPRIPSGDAGKEAVLEVCSVSALAAKLGIARGAISQWRRVPAERVPEISRLTGVPRHVIRPDLFDPPVG